MPIHDHITLPITAKTSLQCAGLSFDDRSCLWSGSIRSRRLFFCIVISKHPLGLSLNFGHKNAPMHCQFVGILATAKRFRSAIIGALVEAQSDAVSAWMWIPLKLLQSKCSRLPWTTEGISILGPAGECFNHMLIFQDKYAGNAIALPGHISGLWCAGCGVIPVGRIGEFCTICRPPEAIPCDAIIAQCRSCGWVGELRSDEIERSGRIKNARCPKCSKMSLKKLVDVSE